MLMGPGGLLEKEKEITGGEKLRLIQTQKRLIISSQ
jgi:hypothetical protein